MPQTAVIFGSLLILQGIGFYVGTGTSSITALIPAFVGLPLLGLGLLAFKEPLRPHAMHAAALVGVLGFLAPLGRMGSAGLSWSAATASQCLMLLLCGGFVAICVKSFVSVRLRRRKAAESTPEP